MTHDSESKFTTLKAFMREHVDLTVDQDNKTANNGEQAYNDIKRSTFIINGIKTSRKVVQQLYTKHESLDPRLEKNKNEDYRSFAKEIFKEMFAYAKTPIPTSAILDEMITNCNQAGYEYMHQKLAMEFIKEYELACSGTNRKVQIECKSSHSINFCINSVMAIQDPNSNMKCSMPFSVKFTLESDKDRIRYKDIEMSVTLPEKLERYVGDQASESLFNTIKEFLYELFEIIFSRCEVIEKDDIIEVTKKGSKIGIISKPNNVLEDMPPPAHAIKIDTLQKTV